MDRPDQEISHREQCPKCAAAGADNSKDNLVVYKDGHARCYSCGYHVSSGSQSTFVQTEETYKPLMSHTTESILGKRGISAEAIKRYDVSTIINEETGEVWVKFPLHDPNRAVYTNHLRQVDTATGTLTRRMAYSPKNRILLPVFGWRLVSKAKTILVCEGETDALIAASRLPKNSPIVAVGLVGTSNAKRLGALLASLPDKKEVVLAFDNDNAGKEALQTVLSYVEAHGLDEQLKFKVLHIPTAHNDLGDWLAAEPELNLEEALVSFSTASVLSGVLDGEQMAQGLESYINELRNTSVVDLKFSPTLSDALRLFPGKLVGVIGDAGQGKSTFAEHLIMEFLSASKRVLMVSQEMTPPEVALKLARMVRNQPLDNPQFLKSLSDEERASIADTVRRIAKNLYTTDGFGRLEVEKIDKTLHLLTSENLKPELVVIDHLLAICDTLEANTIVNTCRDIKELARNHQVCIVLLSHVRKLQSERGKPSRPKLVDAYGGQGLQINADCVAGVSSDKATRKTFVETVKVERLGGIYADVTFTYEDYCLCEDERRNYDEETTDEEEERDDEPF